MRTRMELRSPARWHDVPPHLAVRWWIGAALVLGVPVGAGAQQRPPISAASRIPVASADTMPAPLVRQRFSSRADSLDWARARAAADTARGFRLVISLFDRRLWAIVNDDTLLATPVAVGRNSGFRYQGKRWAFATPRGPNLVRGKDSLPVWVPPDWHYYEAARTRGLRVRYLEAGSPIDLPDGRRLEIRSGVVGLALGSAFSPLPLGEEIIVGGTLFIPPLTTRNRQVEGELGRYRLTLGNSYALHGTPHEESIGRAVTHGCIRVGDDGLAWLYEHVAVGTPVYIF